MSKKKPAKKQPKKPQKQKPKQKPKSQKTVLKQKQSPKPKKKITLTEAEKIKVLKINGKLSNLYRNRRKLVNELDNYIFTNPNKKILTNIGSKTKKETSKKISTVINFLSNKVTALNTKINTLNDKKPTLKKKRAKDLKPVKVEKEIVYSNKMPIEAPVKLSAWERKEIFKRVNYKNLKSVINIGTGEEFTKADKLPELINELNAELQSMGSDDLIYIKVYEDFLTFEILRGELNKPKNKK